MPKLGASWCINHLHQAQRRVEVAVYTGKPSWKRFSWKHGQLGFCSFLYGYSNCTFLVYASMICNWFSWQQKYSVVRCAVFHVFHFSVQKNWPNTHHILYRHASAVCSLRRMPASILRFFFQYITTGPFPQDAVCHINLSLKLCISHSPTNFAIYIHYYIVFWLIYFQGALGAYLNSDQANLPQMSRITHSLKLVVSNLQTLPVLPSSLFPLSLSTL